MGLLGEEFVGNPIRPDDQINDDDIVSDDELEADLLAINPLDPIINEVIMVIGKYNIINLCASVIKVKKFCIPVVHV